MEAARWWAAFNDGSLECTVFRRVKIDVQTELDLAFSSYFSSSVPLDLRNTPLIVFLNVKNERDRVRIMILCSESEWCYRWEVVIDSPESSVGVSRIYGTLFSRNQCTVGVGVANIGSVWDTLNVLFVIAISRWGFKGSCFTTASRFMLHEEGMLDRQRIRSSCNGTYFSAFAARNGNVNNREWSFPLIREALDLLA